MTSISGIQTNGAVKIASTWGTAASVGGGNKFPAKYSKKTQVQELLPDQVGSGLVMETYVTRGSLMPELTLAADMGYRNCCDNILAQFMGTAGAPTEATGGKGDYVHTIQFNPTLNAKYLTACWQGDNSSDIFEMPTVAIDSISYKTSSVPGFMQFGAHGVANDLYMTGGTIAPTNTSAGIVASTIGDQERVACHFADTFWINAQTGGALSSSNVLPIIGFELNLARPQKLVGEIKGSSGFAAPITDGLFNGTLKITCRELVDFTYLLGWQLESQYKASFIVQGSQISSGSTNKTVAWYFPVMELVNEPTYDVTAPGQNPVVYEFRLLKASANPTGMADVYPYCKITNTLATSLLA